MTKSVITIAVTVSVGLVLYVLLQRTCSSLGEMADEVAKAQTAKPVEGDSVFAKIIRRELPSEIVYEDDKVNIELLIIIIVYF